MVILTTLILWIHEHRLSFHLFVSSKEAVLNGSRSTSPAYHGYTPILGTEEAGKNAHLPVFPWERLNCILSQLLPEDLASNYPASRCWLQSSPLGHWQVLEHSQILGTTKNKDCSLDNHKGLRDNPELGSDWLTSFISYKRAVCQDYERWLSYLMFRNQLGETRKMKTYGNMFQTKEQNKSLETNLSETEISDLPNREFMQISQRKQR